MSEYSEIVPLPGQLKQTLQVLNKLAGGHADATTNGAYEIVAPTWLVEKYLAAIQPPAPKRRPRRTKEEQEDEQ